MNYLQLLKARDKRESKLSSMQHQVKIHEEQRERMRATFEEDLALYQEWKKKNNIEGLIF